VASRAVLTERDTLRIRVTCGESLSGPARFVVGSVGERRVELEPDCRRSVEIPLRRRFAKRLRSGKVRTVRVTAIAPGGDPVTTKLRVRI
jgi:hypothetical protein